MKTKTIKKKVLCPHPRSHGMVCIISSIQTDKHEIEVPLQPSENFLVHYSILNNKQHIDKFEFSQIYRMLEPLGHRLNYA